MLITKTKPLLATILFAFLASASLALTGCKEPAAKNEHAHQYTCPMHPDVVQNSPGDCPKCGMKLVEKR